MKKALNGLSLAVLAFGGFQLVRQLTPGPARNAGQAVFAEFPTGHARTVTFQFDPGSFHTFTPLEIRHQMLDWLLYTVVCESGLNTDAVRKVMFDLPPLRAKYIESVASFEYGVTRSRAIGDGEVVALVPKAGEVARADHLAHIADREYKNAGEIPKRVHVFEYELNPEDDSARITRIAAVTGRELFSSGYGYVETRVQSLDDLQRFMGAVDDITSVRSQDGLILGGRRIGEGYRGIRVEEVAALWKSEISVQTMQKEYRDFEARWQAQTYRTEFEKQILLKQFETELAALRKRMPHSGGKGGVVDHSGFSLAPAYDYVVLSRLFEKLRGLLDRTSAEPAKIESAGRALANRDEGPFLGVLYDLSQSKEPADRLVAELTRAVLREGTTSSAARFQHARYDGLLKGTEAGMVLFYTDVLAKLWAMDYIESAPSRQVEDFVPLLKVDVSPIYYREMRELSSTRLWFGPRDDGFQKTERGMLFARNATRVYAASSNVLKPGEEAEPNAASAQFLGWWNSHYEDIARCH